jgi:hypothetical protein
LRKYVLVVAVVIFCSVLGGFYYVILQDSPSTADTSNVEGPSSGYILETNLQETKIFLVSVDNPRYGVYDWSDAEGWGVYDGDPCFIVNVTVRNDYTTDSLWTDEDSPSGLYNNHVKLTAYLYDQQGRVDTVDVTYPINSLHGGHVFVVEPEEAQSVELYLATESKDIERYEIYVAYIGSLPEP